MICQLRHPKRPSCFLFLEVDSFHPNSPDAGILFRAESVRWDRKTWENISVEKALIPAVDFSAWWKLKMRQGWRVAKK